MNDDSDMTVVTGHPVEVVLLSFTKGTSGTNAIFIFFYSYGNIIRRTWQCYNKE